MNYDTDRAARQDLSDNDFCDIVFVKPETLDNISERERNMELLTEAAARISEWWANTPVSEVVWLTVGFTAQLMFSMRFIVQWIASERARRSIVPEAFWYFSFLGGLMLFAYAVYRFDPVFMLGQGTGLLIYARNIHFIWTHKRRDAENGEDKHTEEKLGATKRPHQQYPAE